MVGAPHFSGEPWVRIPARSVARASRRRTLLLGSGDGAERPSATGRLFASVPSAFPQSKKEKKDSFIITPTYWIPSLHIPPHPHDKQKAPSPLLSAHLTSHTPRANRTKMRTQALRTLARAPSLAPRLVRQLPAAPVHTLNSSPLSPRRAFSTCKPRWSATEAAARKRGGSKLFKSADEAVADVKSGSTILSSGFGLCGVAGMSPLTDLDALRKLSPANVCAAQRRSSRLSSAGATPSTP